MLKGRLFFGIWLILFALYLFGVSLYGLLSGLHGLDLGLVWWVLRPKMLVGSGLVSLLMTIPLFQFMLSARSTELYKAGAVRPNSDPFVLPDDAEDPKSKEKRMRIVRKQSALSIKLWMLFVILMSLLGLYLMFHSRAISNLHTSDDVQVGAIIQAAPEISTPIEMTPPDLPKFGSVQKSSEQVAADMAYIEQMVQTYGGTDSALEVELDIGWTALSDRKSDEAMHSFNRAWLLSTSSSDALWGMGLVEGIRGHLDSSIALIEEALALDNSRPVMHCDIARSYLNKSELPGENQIDMLQQAQKHLAIVEIAQGMTSACYHTAALVARAAGDETQADEYEKRVDE